MRTQYLRLLSLLLWSAPLAFAGDELGCGTTPENDLRVRAVHERVLAQRDVRARVEPSAAAKAPQLRDGAFYLEADEDIVPGYRPFDLAGQSLVFEPRGGTKFAVSRTSLQYVEPSGAAVHDFITGARTYERNLGFTFPIFGRNVTKVYVTAFNAIQFDPPSGEPAAAQFDDLEAAVHRNAVLSPLMITRSKPSRLAYPELFVDETADALIVTWRSTAGQAFGYDVQAQLRRDGSVVYAYRSMRLMSWGAPVVSAGFDPATAPRQQLQAITSAANNTASHVSSELRPMVDFVNLDASRIDGTDLYSVRMKFSGPIDPSKIPADVTLRYLLTIDDEDYWVEITASNKRVLPYLASRWVDDGPSMHLSGDTLEIFGMQRRNGTRSLRVTSYTLPNTRVADTVGLVASFAEPSRKVATDFTALAGGSELTAPVAEAFVLAPFNPYATWEKVQNTYELSDYEYDGALMFQTFFTDLIFVAGAYATGGNAQVNGIKPVSQASGLGVPRSPTLMHMNQLAYGWFATDQNASNVMLHELGHRWSYFFSIMENGSPKRSLNPVSAHPAGYVHNPAAFAVTPDLEQASVMGGGFFTMQQDGKYRARAINVGYSWTDLYLMGLAAPEEVQPWFYLAETNPPLAQEYWPVDNMVVTGLKRDVNVQQIIDVHGARNPSAAMSQKTFRVVFILVTEEGKEPTADEIAKLNTWRSIMERNFSAATGGRGRLVTTFVRPARKRALR